MTPILNVRSVPKSIEYYEKMLGFERDWVLEDPATYASVSRGDVSIFLCQNGQDGKGTWLSIFVENVDALYKEYKKSGAVICQPPTTFPWGAGR